MHVRFTMCLGMPVVDDGSGDLLGAVSGIFLHPDTGTVEGLFVKTANGEEFLAAADIGHWGRTIVVRNSETLSPLEDRVRLLALWNEGRTIVGQPVVTEGGTVLGRCRDVQFETETFRLEWIFPRRWLRWRRPIPAGAIVEVRADAVCVRDVDVPAPTKADDAAMRVVDAAMGMPPAQG